MRFLPLATVACLLYACATGGAIVVDGIEIYENYWQRTVDEVGARASFDLNCPREGLHFTLFAKEGRHPTQVGVSGCGKRATYVRLVMRNAGTGYREAGPWQMNAVTQPVGFGAASPSGSGG